MGVRDALFFQTRPERGLRKALLARRSYRPYVGEHLYANSLQGRDKAVNVGPFVSDCIDYAHDKIHLHNIRFRVTS